MRLAVWNVSHWARTQEQREAVWMVLRDEIKADIALLQEVVPPHGVDAVYQPIGGTRRWGSAVVGITVPVSQVTEAKGRANSTSLPMIHTRPGSVAIASATFGDRPLTFVSMYGLIEHGYADPTVQRQLSDLAPLFDDPAHADRIILGGDLNITTQWTGTDARYRNWSAATFGRISAFGLVDCLDVYRPDGPLADCGCLDGAACRHIRTQRHARSDFPWQNDYLFASAKITDRAILKSAYVYDSDAIRTLGDHLPLVADFDV